VLRHRIVADATAVAAAQWLSDLSNDCPIVRIGYRTSSEELQCTLRRGCARTALFSRGTRSCADRFVSRPRGYYYGGWPVFLGFTIAAENRSGPAREAKDVEVWKGSGLCSPRNVERVGVWV